VMRSTLMPRSSNRHRLDEEDPSAREACSEGAHMGLLRKPGASGAQASGPQSED
jgi:hypothetical protein